ncbi:hypothetical protein EYF80_036288 [Liparis tanakae]|uniref:Uncharacterized protein n=1 Tax=Liparis tanakae TaxID=230148 RepID=A0A4Z2GJT2_9TELE|nr:hypothetical protein EYF80_036288 [Liparis tanakae]
MKATVVTAGVRHQSILLLLLYTCSTWFRISILDNLLSGGNVGSSVLSSSKATLKDTTRTRSLAACADRYFAVARLFRRFSSLLSAGTWAERVSVCPQGRLDSRWSGLSITPLPSDWKDAEEK